MDAAAKGILVDPFVELVRTISCTTPRLQCSAIVSASNKHPFSFASLLKGAVSLKCRIAQRNTLEFSLSTGTDPAGIHTLPNQLPYE